MFLFLLNMSSESVLLSDEKTGLGRDGGFALCHRDVGGCKLCFCIDLLCEFFHSGINVRN